MIGSMVAEFFFFLFTARKAVDVRWEMVSWVFLWLSRHISSQYTPAKSWLVVLYT